MLARVFPAHANTPPARCPRAARLQCRLQLGGTERYHSYRGPVDCLRQTVQQEGLRGLMRGLSGTMAREIPGNAIYFSTYRLLRYWVSGGDPAATAAAASGATVAAASQPRSLLAFLADSASAVVCGGLAGMVMWAAVLPLDVAKTRIQTAYPGSYQDVGVARQLHMVYREGGRQLPGLVRQLGGLEPWESTTQPALCLLATMPSHPHPPTPTHLLAGGIQALYAGLSPTLARAFPANAAQWLAWELCMQQMQQWGGGGGRGGSST